MRQPFRLLTIGSLVGAAGATAGALVLLYSSHKVNVAAEVGKWLLTVAAALVLTGALSMIVRDIDQRRSEHDAWHAVLNDLVAVNQTVALAQFRMSAYKSALMYEEQLGELIRARVELRRICVIGIVMRDTELWKLVKAMRKYLEDLGHECNEEFVRVARQQRLDELWLAEQIKVANDGTGVPVLPDALLEPSEAWRLLRDSNRFPRLAALLDQDAFSIDTFRSSYKRAKARLEMHAGFESRPTKALKDAAGKLSERATSFMENNQAELPKKVKRCISERVRDLEEARDTEDPEAIIDAMVKLNEPAAKAVGIIYPVRKRKVAAGAAAATRENQDRPATSPP